MRKTLVLALTLVALVVPPGAAAQTAAPAIAATDGPGALSHFDLARKDCIGTARNTTSKVWFTLANGVPSDVYYPTIDNTNVESLQYVVTDGSSFTDLQTRDTTYTVTSKDDPQSLTCQVTTTAKSGKYRIVSDYVTDPAHNTLLVQARFEPLVGKLGDYHLYVRFDPTINGNGGGGAGNGGSDTASIDHSTSHQVAVACDPQTATNAANRDYAQPVCSALDADSGFLQVSNGFVGAASDGLTQLDASHKLTTLTSDASNGNVVQTVEVDLRHPNQGHDDSAAVDGASGSGSGNGGDDNGNGRPGTFTLALGFGQHASDALSSAQSSLHNNFQQVKRAYVNGWRQYDAGLTAPPHNMSGVSQDTWKRLVDEYFLSVNVVKASEDKTFPGALIASIASPWGQAISAGDPANTYFGSYREVFARDVYEAWTGLLLAGDTATARDVVTFLFNKQQLADGSFPRNSLVNGKLAPDSFNTQLDECSYPILMAYQLHMFGGALYTNHIKPAANFVVSHGPSFGPERWEEQSGFSPSTISAEITGLVTAAVIADANNDPVSASIWRGVADDWQRQLEGWTVTTNGPLDPNPYFIRLSKTGDPNAAISYNVGNGGPTLDQREVIDAGFLELVRLGLKPSTDAIFGASLKVVDTTIEAQPSTGSGWHRYNGDGYGDGLTDGHPWAPSNKGSGHLWPLLAEERGEYDLITGDRASAISRLQTMLQSSSGVGLIPEQVWEGSDLPPSPFGTDPTVASIGFANGHPAGSAAPLTWASGSFARLMRDIAENKLLEQPAATTDRYVRHQPPAATSITLTAPADQSAVSASPVTVSGTTVPGSNVAIAATNTDNTHKTSTTSVTADAGGKFSTTVPVDGGTTVITAVSTSPSGATASTHVTIVFDFTPGTVIFDVSDPSGDDNGPGTFQYPTASDFQPGAFDLQRFQVIDDGTTVTFKVQTRNLSPTFGSPLGAQLLDVYVHVPNASPTSTAAAFPQRNYSIAGTGAWSRLIEVQGFGQQYKDAGGATLGQVTINANAISRFISFSVPAASLGHPGSGWGFTVVLTSQDGFSSDQARTFTPTPQPFNLGVCAPGGTAAICSADPATMPKAMDVLTPSGVSQATELNPLLGPVVILPVTVP
jgi:glucan 1,4-alpha-glucosidase